MNSKQKRAILDQILTSNEFDNADTFKNLLTFLVESEIKNDVPKESEIAFSIFHKDSNYDPVTDATVRVYVHKLRLKLDSYYQNEGRFDKQKLTIPKGHYKVVFDETGETIKQERLTHPLLRYVALGVGVAFLMYILLNMFDGSLENELAGDKIWHELLNSNYPVLFVLGNHYIYELKRDNDEIWHVKNSKIKSRDELENYLDRHPQYRDQVQKSNIGYLSKDIAVGMSLCLPILNAHNVDYAIKYSSDIVIDDLQNNEILFIGSYSQLGRLAVVLNSIGIHCNMETNQVSVKNSETGSIDVYDTYYEQFGIRKDICIVAKLPLPNDHSIFMFVSLHTIGNEITLNRFTDVDFLNEFQHNFGNQYNSDYFVSIFEVRGIQRTGLNENLLYFGEIDPQKHFLSLIE